jgi:hypothetical protein
LNVILQVPLGDEDSLIDLALSNGQDDTITTERRFDGDTVAQLLYYITSGGAGLNLLTTWIKTRAEARKYYKVVIDGDEYEGYTEAEVARLIKRVRSDSA